MLEIINHEFLLRNVMIFSDDEIRKFETRNSEFALGTWPASALGLGRAEMPSILFCPTTMLSYSTILQSSPLYNTSPPYDVILP